MNARAHRNLLVALSIVLLGSSTAFAEVSRRDTKPRKDGVFRPNKPGKGTAPSMALPKMPRPSAKVTTWAVNEQWTSTFGGSRVDPYKVEVSGVLENSRLTIEQQNRSADVQIPAIAGNRLTPEGRQRLAKLVRKLAHEGRWYKMSREEKRALVNKMARQDRSKQWQMAVSKAQQYSPLLEMTARELNPQATNVVERPEVLATHTPLRITGKDQFGRRLSTVHTKVVGLNTTVEQLSQWNSRVGNVTGTRTTGGTIVPARTPEVNTNNLFITPAYGERGAEQVKLLGLAAFDQSVQVKVTNTRTGEVSTLYPTTKNGLATHSGTQGLIVKALQGDKLQVSVTHLGEQNKSAAAEKSFNVRVPVLSGPAKDKGLRPAFTKRDVRYYRVNLVD